MGLDTKIIEFVVLHASTIWKVVFAIMLALVALWIFLGLGKEDDKSNFEDDKLKDIEDSLKKLLQAATVPDGTVATATKQIKDSDSKPAATAAAAPTVPNPQAAAMATAAAVDADMLNKIKQENEVRAKKIAELEAQLKAAQEASKTAASVAQAASDPADKKKIEDLEKKLGEYAIIEDDIANLNLYKEENVRLKTELEKVRGGGAPESAAVEAASPEPAKAPEPAPAPAAAAPPAPEPTPAPAPVAAAPVASEPEPVKAPEQPMVAPAAASTTPTPEEIAAASAVVTGESEPVAKTIDSEKLLAEFDALVAAGNDPVPPAKEGEPKDSGDALINEFENFMKSSNQ